MRESCRLDGMVRRSVKTVKRVSIFCAVNYDIKDIFVLYVLRRDLRMMLDESESDASFYRG